MTQNILLLRYVHGNQIKILISVCMDQEIFNQRCNKLFIITQKRKDTLMCKYNQDICQQTEPNSRTIIAICKRVVLGLTLLTLLFTQKLHITV